MCQCHAAGQPEKCAKFLKEIPMCKIQATFNIMKVRGDVMITKEVLSLILQLTRILSVL